MLRNLPKNEKQSHFDEGMVGHAVHMGTTPEKTNLGGPLFRIFIHRKTWNVDAIICSSHTVLC